MYADVERAFVVCFLAMICLFLCLILKIHLFLSQNVRKLFSQSWAEELEDCKNKRGWGTWRSFTGLSSRLLIPATWISMVEDQ